MPVYGDLTLPCHVADPAGFLSQEGEGVGTFAPLKFCPKNWKS